MARAPEKPEAGEADRAVDRRWHLSRSGTELDTTELEFAIMRTAESFGRWQTECLASVVDLAASGPENAMLHVIRMNDRAKSVKELARLTNRDDVPNIQYSLRKLIGAGLIERFGTGRSGVTYAVTAKGRQVTDAYADVRRALLISALEALPDFRGKLQEATRTLDLLSGIYDQAARVAATHRRT